jgi:hypothetical protein
MLAAAGFKLLPADNAAKAHSPEGLPPATMNYYVNKERPVSVLVRRPLRMQMSLSGEIMPHTRVTRT